MVDWWEDGAIIVGGRVFVTTMDHSFNWIFSRIGFVHILLDLHEPKPDHHPLCVVLCCVVAAQIGDGVVLSWPKSVVVFCFCEAQINGSHTCLYLTLTLFLSLRLIWKFLAQDFCGFDVKALLVAGKFWKIQEELIWW